MHLIVVPQLSSGQQHSYSTKTRQAGRANEQSYVFSYVYSLLIDHCFLDLTIIYEDFNKKKKLFTV